MARILDPANTEDNTAFDGIRDLGNTAATNAEIAKNPLYLAAESYIIGRDANATDRNYAQRSQIISALQFLTAAYLLQGGGATATNAEEAATGAVTGRTILGQTIRYASGGESRSVRLSALDVKDRIEFLEDTAIEIMDELTGTQTATADGIAVKAATTSSKKLDFTYDHPYYDNDN